MKLDKSHMLLYAVTDRAWAIKQSLIEQIEDALKGGATCIQLREKNLSHDEFLKEALQVKELCKKYNVPFIINDNVEIAIECKADGIHVGQGDMAVDKVRSLVGKDMIIGVSTQTVEQAIQAEKDGADYLGVGAVFSTSTKLDANAVSHDTLRKICEEVNIPVVAIGGINKNNIEKLSNTKINGVAIISGIFAADNIEEECKTLRRISNTYFNII